jgi:hypothetical protein
VLTSDHWSAEQPDPGPEPEGDLHYHQRVHVAALHLRKIVDNANGDTD